MGSEVGSRGTKKGGRCDRGWDLRGGRERRREEGGEMGGGAKVSSDSGKGELPGTVYTRREGGLSLIRRAYIPLEE